MRRALPVLAFAGAALLAPLAGAQGRSMPTYEPQQRVRSALFGCTATEVPREAMCVKKCGAGFRMDFSARKPRCIGLKADARFTPPKPAYRPPAPGPARKAPPNEMG